jgi:hypothetical protein
VQSLLADKEKNIEKEMNDINTAKTRDLIGENLVTQYNSCCEGIGVNFLSDQELRAAVSIYASNSGYAIEQFGEINCWGVDLVTDFSWLFQGYQTFNEPLFCWNVSSAEDMSGMFYDAASFNQEIRSWNLTSVHRMSHMFYGATAFNQNLCDWYASFSTNMQLFDNMFSSSGCQVKLPPNLLRKVTFCQKCHFEENISKKGNVLVFCFYHFFVYWNAHVLLLCSLFYSPRRQSLPS